MTAHRGVGIAVSLGLALGCADRCLAAPPVFSTPTISTTIGLGTIVADSTASTFSVDASSGTVTKVSGTAIRLTSGAASTPTVTIACTANCKATFPVTISSGSTIGGRPTTIGAFNVANLSGSAGVTFSPTSPSPAAPLTFNIVSTKPTFTVTFNLGLTATFTASSTTGNTTWSYTVLAN